MSGADKLFARDRVTAPSAGLLFSCSSAELVSSGSALLDRKLGRNLSMDRCRMCWLGGRERKGNFGALTLLLGLHRMSKA